MCIYPGELDTLRKEIAPLRQAVQNFQHIPAEPAADAEQNAKLQEKLIQTEQENANLIEQIESLREQHSQALKKIIQNEVSI